jgi:hypothetical protein
MEELKKITILSNKEVKRELDLIGIPYKNDEDAVEILRKLIEEKGKEGKYYYAQE